MGVVTAVLVLEVIPHANFLARQLVFDAVSTSFQLRVRERVFQSPLPGLKVYVERINENNGHSRAFSSPIAAPPRPPRSLPPRPRFSPILPVCG